MKTLTFFGIICLIFMTEIASADDENLYQTSQCTNPKTYDMSLEVQDNSLNVVSTVLIDFSCAQHYNITLYVKQFCDIQKIGVYTDIPYKVMKDGFHWKTIVEPSSTNQLKSVNISLIKNETRFVEEQTIPLESGLYTINTTYNCSLEKVATIISYVNQSEKKGLVFASRIPAEWIFPYWENPAIKARFTIKIKHKEDERGFSNMVTYVGRQRFDTIFDTTPLLSTHLVTVVVVPHMYVDSRIGYGKVVGHNEPIPESSFVKFYAGQQIRSYEYPALFNFDDSRVNIRTKLKDIISSSWVSCLVLPVNFTNYESIITKGLVIFREADVIFDQEIDSFLRHKQITRLAVRSMLQEIFSEWLLIFKKSDPLLVEGFLTFFEVYNMEQSYTLLKQPLMKQMLNQTHYFLDQWRNKDKAI